MTTAPAADDGRPATIGEIRDALRQHLAAANAAAIGMARYPAAAQQYLALFEYHHLCACALVRALFDAAE